MDALVEEFSDARFIFVIRDCWSWLDSMLNMALCFGPDMPRWMVEHCRTILGPGYSANLAQNASELTRRLPLLVDAGLSYWSRANQFVLAALPMKRSLVLRTAELSGSLSRLAGFVGVPEQTLRADLCHVHRGQHRYRTLRSVDRHVLVARHAADCAQLMHQFFPRLMLDDVLRPGPIAAR